MKVKEMCWHDEPGRPLDGKSNGSIAVDDVWIENRIRIYIDYNVRRGPSSETDNRWFVYINFGRHEEAIHEEVSSLEEGKLICAHYREVFWKNLIEKIYNCIFKE